MRCESCSATVRPVVVSDIDGVLADYHNSFSNFACQYHGRPRPTGQWNGLGEMEDFLKLTKQEYREAKLAYRQGGNKRWSPLLSGAVQFLDTINSEGADLWLATTRPWQRLDNIDPDTRFWLSQQGILYQGLIYGDDKYHQLVECVDPRRVILVVDDLAENLAIAESLGFATFQPARPHNEAESARWHTRGSLNKANQFIFRLIEAWREMAA